MNLIRQHTIRTGPSFLQTVKKPDSYSPGYLPFFVDLGSDHVERLRTKGLIKRKICKNDRRRAEVIITGKGINLLKEIDKFQHQFDNIFENISEVEAKNVNLLLDKMRG